jgi:hypothetical protein
MERRQYLGIVGAVAVFGAGCTSDNSGDNPEGGNGNDGTPEGEAAGGPPTLLEHDVARGPAGGYDVMVSMENETEQELTRAVGEVAVFNDNERLSTGRAAAIDLPPGVSTEESALLEQFRADDVTHYTITMVGETPDYEETATTEHEFSGDEFREKLQ